MRCKSYLPEHKHDTVAQATLCWRRHHPEYFGLDKATTATVQPPPVPASRPVAVPPVATHPVSPASVPPVARRNFGDGSWRHKPVKDTQINKVKSLNGDATYAAKLTRGECADYIDRLMNEPRTEPTPVSTPAYQTQRNVYADRLKMVKGMIDLVPEGNYATAPQGEDRHVDFVRITRPTSGRLKGTTHIQTRHSDLLKTQIIGNPGGFWEIKKWSVLDMLMEIIADYKTCALRYSVEATACSHCATPLTDDRSRHYLVGPICEKMHGYTWPVEFADEFNGMTFEQLQARGMPFKQHHAAFLMADAG